MTQVLHNADAIDIKLLGHNFKVSYFRSTTIDLNSTISYTDCRKCHVTTGTMSNMARQVNFRPLCIMCTHVYGVFLHLISQQGLPLWNPKFWHDQHFVILHSKKYYLNIWFKRLSSTIHHFRPQRINIITITSTSAVCAAAILLFYYTDNIISTAYFF